MDVPANENPAGIGTGSGSDNSDALEKTGTAAAGSDGGSEDKTEAAEPENKADDKPADDKQDEGRTGLSDDDTPITDWSAVDLGLPEDAAIDENVLAAFGEKSVELGLTPKQAKALASWQLELARETYEAQLEAGVAELRKAWGKKANANQKAVVALLSRVDRQLGSDEFSRAIGASGAAKSPAVCKGLLAIAQMLSEDAMGRGGSGDMPVKPETALEGIENAFREMRAKL